LASFPPTPAAQDTVRSAAAQVLMDAGLQSLQYQLKLYFGGKASVPAPLPNLKMVI
jgi:hypothetical protein